MTKQEMKVKAQDLLMAQISTVGYCDAFEAFIEQCGGNPNVAEEIMMGQMNRIAKLFGYKNAWWS